MPLRVKLSCGFVCLLIFFLLADSLINTIALFLMLLGVTSNAIAIVMNGWKMPVQLLPGERLLDNLNHCVANENTQCFFFIDRFRASYSFIFSVGDVFLFFGALLTLLAIIFPGLTPFSFESAFEFSLFYAAYRLINPSKQLMTLALREDIFLRGFLFRASATLARLNRRTQCILLTNVII